MLPGERQPAGAAVALRGLPSMCGSCLFFHFLLPVSFLSEWSEFSGHFYYFVDNESRFDRDNHCLC